MKNFKLNESDILSNQDWTFPTDTIYGPGRFKEIGQLCQNNDIKNPLIVSDSGSKNLSFIKNLKTLLSEKDIKCSFYFEISPNPRDDEIAKGCAEFKNGQHDAIIAIGGGSAMDGGKAICLTVNSEIPLWDLEFEQTPKEITKENAFPKIITIPPTEVEANLFEMLRLKIT